MLARRLFIGVDVQRGSTQVVALDETGHVALRTYLPLADEAEVTARLVELLGTLGRAHGRAELVLCVDGERWTATLVGDAAAEQLAGPLHVVRNKPGGPPVELLTQDCWHGPYRDAWRLALLAALGCQPELTSVGADR
jgi:hypothetical protein